MSSDEITVDFDYEAPGGSTPWAVFRVAGGHRTFVAGMAVTLKGRPDHEIWEVVGVHIGSPPVGRVVLMDAAHNTSPRNYERWVMIRQIGRAHV